MTTEKEKEMGAYALMVSEIAKNTKRVEDMQAALELQGEAIHMLLTSLQQHMTNSSSRDASMIELLDIAVNRMAARVPVVGTIGEPTTLAEAPAAVVASKPEKPKRTRKDRSSLYSVVDGIISHFGGAASLADIADNIPPMIRDGLTRAQLSTLISTTNRYEKGQAGQWVVNKKYVPGQPRKSDLRKAAAERPTPIVEKTKEVPRIDRRPYEAPKLKEPALSAGDRKDLAAAMAVVKRLGGQPMIISEKLPKGWVDVPAGTNNKN